MTDISNTEIVKDIGLLIRDIEQGCEGTPTWFVMNADETAYCMSFDHNSHSSPAAACEEWMAEQNPEWISTHGYHVVQKVEFSRAERLALEAARALRGAQRKLDGLLAGSRALKQEAIRCRGMVDGRGQPDAYGLANFVQAYSSRMMDVICGDITADLAPFPAPEATSMAPGFIKPDNEHSVYFYEQDYYVLSNFSAFTLMWKGRRFHTSEAAYHWEKFPHLPHVQEAILAAPSAHEAFKLAQGHVHVRIPIWDAVKVDLMRKILREKVCQHRYVLRKLLATGNRVLVEDSWRDGFWGWGEDARGRNMLGQLWIEIRTALQRAGVTGDSSVEQIGLALGLVPAGDQD